LFAPHRTDLDVVGRVQLLTSGKTQEPTFSAALLLSDSRRAFMWADVTADFSSTMNLMTSWPQASLSDLRPLAAR
jgi:hypothetical protein